MYNRKRFATKYSLFVICYLLFVICSNAVRAQSVAYYPWNGLLAISTKPTRAVWADARFQTNTLFGSLSTELLAFANVKQTETTQFYAGGGVRFNFVGKLAGQTSRLVEGYLLGVGTRLKPFKEHRNVQIAFELAPFVEHNFKSGILKSNFGVVYVFK
ncbi:MAG: hypothetical protein EAZ14_00490 [Runella slithyformis]|nr:MAG: hypothetical protein EAZ46_03820 [Runella sp.]TAG21353.1 MAG: hypothetical protein EAZ38_08395 [Cytophagales bacterium]TAG40689.1 MAG: hypothetical protein EAZ32_05655 [Cytophagia bacterium]TAG53398.1 MAG: hypothetical protein EAZ29_05720 [Runella slithyformis]TAG62474.1 MAG: hypothetical protein EAZ26_12345 [Runella slithyformis]